MPVTIRAGIVKATFKISNILASMSVKPILAFIIDISGAWLNQTRKVMKNANQVLCRILDRPWKDKKLCFKDDSLMKKPDLVNVKIINNRKIRAKTTPNGK